ncbi:hypothetical protein DICSQDRAFT_66970, partial [Dichomitus squalens LYAD-421 SS1]
WNKTSFSKQDAGLVWLLEPERSVAMERWSGTMAHPNHADKRGATLTAFVHFAYVYSHRTLVFSDLQTSSGRLQNGGRGDILFDVMTHTESGDSGIGDYGETGIKTFLADHICNDICVELGLRDISDPLENRDRIRARHNEDKYNTDSSDDKDDEENDTRGSGLVSYISSREGNDTDDPEVA